MNMINKRLEELIEKYKITKTSNLKCKITS